MEVRHLHQPLRLWKEGTMSHTVTVIIRLEELTGAFLSVHEAYLDDHSGYASDKETKRMNDLNNGTEYEKISFDPKEVF